MTSSFFYPRIITEERKLRTTLAPDKKIACGEIRHRLEGSPLFLDSLDWLYWTINSVTNALRARP